MKIDRINVGILCAAMAQVSARLYHGYGMGVNTEKQIIPQSRPRAGLFRVRRGASPSFYSCLPVRTAGISFLEKSPKPAARSYAPRRKCVKMEKSAKSLSQLGCAEVILNLVSCIEDESGKKVKEPRGSY